MKNIDEQIAKRATELVGAEKTNFENVLKEAEKTRRECQTLKTEIEELKVKEVETLAEIEKSREKLNAEKEKFFLR